MLKLSKEQLKWANGIFEKIEQKYRMNAQNLTDIFPYTTDSNGLFIEQQFLKDRAGVQWWTNGFYAGLLWLLYSKTGNDIYKSTAKKQEKMLDDAFLLYDELNHDVGFMWGLSAKPSYTFDGDIKSRSRALLAANILAGRLNVKGRYLRAWNHGDYTIIDCMMNIPLLYWASRETGDERFKYIAELHADSTLKHHLREDGSVAHIVVHDPLKDASTGTLKGQGISVGSAWSRGQAWGIYGFILSYIHTGEERYLDVAKKIADYFIEGTKARDYRVPVDFCQPENLSYFDNSAAVCGVCGIIEIAKLINDKRYLNEALNILAALEADCDFSKENQSILQNCAASFDEHRQMPLIYGDFFLTEAILKLLGNEFLIW
ncbi:MAG: glycoside hydrolase family 88 protein [Clostridia bacterium]|nr:glycoside hydrolase family 88 protein [Clostridia bacterium]